MRILTIGRKDTDIVLQDPNKDVSRLHAELTISDDGRYYLADCGSSNGTFVRRHGAGRWDEVKQEFVTEQDLLRFGTCEIALGDLLRLAPRSAASGREFASEPISRNLVARRHPETGAIIWEAGDQG